MFVQAMKHKWCKSGDSAQELNALIVAFETRILFQIYNIKNKIIMFEGTEKTSVLLEPRM